MRYVISFYIYTNGQGAGTWQEDGNLNIAVVEAESPWRAFLESVVAHQNATCQHAEEKWSFERAFYMLFEADLAEEDSDIYIYASAYNLDTQAIEEICLPHVQLNRLRERHKAVQDATASVNTIVAPVALDAVDSPPLQLALAHIDLLRKHYREQLQIIDQAAADLRKLFWGYIKVGRKEQEHYSLWKSEQSTKAKPKTDFKAKTPPKTAAQTEDEED